MESPGLHRSVAGAASEVDIYKSTFKEREHVCKRNFSK